MPLTCRAVAQSPGDAGDLEGVGQPRTKVVVLGGDEDLCLTLQAPKSRGVQHALPVDGEWVDVLR